MVYACAFCPISQSKDLAKRDFADSKTLTAEKREQIFAQLEGDVSMGYKFHSLAAHIISARMLQRSKVSLNALANEATFGLIDEALGDGINLKQVFVDTVGDAGTHQSRLASRFPGIEFTVCPKADALYPIVSAASIVAKVIRDKQVRELESKLGADAGSFGSGYPADPTTKAWLRNNLDPVFGYPNAVRFSWQTCERSWHTVNAWRQGLNCSLEPESMEDRGFWSLRVPLCFGSTIKRTMNIKANSHSQPEVLPVAKPPLL